MVIAVPMTAAKLSDELLGRQSGQRAPAPTAIASKAAPNPSAAEIAIHNLKPRPPGNSIGSIGSSIRIPFLRSKYVENIIPIDEPMEPIELPGGLGLRWW